ncbi:endonuclease 8-like 1 isoform X1 [Corythoichthys intestinalis]|uniref:endonuclease 8-like 1 isoform X1 n=1 Tax=Corythoichthys intestinalis TaxID=161448 RepID=UPI0025A60B7A|nr:endonuclease 8-like 1 isoform X1 [Corythoichthys intestinalis]
MQKVGRHTDLCYITGTMPEGPELHLASLFVNKTCEGVVFAGSVRKSEVSKNPDVAFTCEAYRISAISRGKEVKLTLTPIKSDDTKAEKQQQPLDIVFRFGMSGFFRFTAEDELPKHAHLCFYSKEQPRRVLSYVDARRFGSWQPQGTWQPDRGPCIMFEYKSFRENVVSHLSDRAFDRPICEVLLNQKYFNGIGNYLRAEILYRLHIPPFVPARSVLEGLDLEDFCLEDKKPVKNELVNKKTAKKFKVKEESADLLRLCHTVPLEVVHLGGKGYDPEKADYSGFNAWLQCYYVDGMKSIRDHNGRTMWFKGDAGPMAPKDSKSPKAKKRTKKDEDHDYNKKKKGPRRQSESTEKKKTVKKEARAAKTEKDLPQKEAIRQRTVTQKSGDQETTDNTEPEEGSRRRSSRLTRQNVR